MRSLHGRILQLVADQSERVLGNGSEAASAVTIAPSNWNARWLGQKPLDDADLAPRGQGRLPTVGWFPELLLSDAEPVNAGPTRARPRRSLPARPGNP
jgi:hypothetical protein